MNTVDKNNSGFDVTQTLNTSPIKVLQRKAIPYAFMSIGLIWYLIFLVYPMLQSFIISLTT